MFGNEFSLARTWAPWRELSRLHDEFNRVFSNASDGRIVNTPAINVWTNDEGAILRALLPDTAPEDIDISVLGDSVTISGKRNLPEADKDTTYHRREREFGSFSRTLQMPYRLESDQVEATFKNGILELKLPRANADRPKRIAVKSH
ncbi:MAG: Hsp20/alpha crystallin family protein [Deltaproteobacteria bacterium]|nr:Hsp20/alpha crystallin family protein [Deltaproteobacteria bacterium]